MSKLIFTKHAVERMFERSVSKFEIEAALKSPTKIEEYTEGYRVFKKFNSKMLVVGLFVVEKEVSVATVFWK